MTLFSRLLYTIISVALLGASIVLIGNLAALFFLPLALALVLR